MDGDTPKENPVVIDLSKIQHEPKWLVWSNQRGMWWRSNHAGYTSFIEEAGRYSHGEAARIVAAATCDGELRHRRRDPYSGEEYAAYDEVMVLAP